MERFFLNKLEWSDADWTVYFSNLEILCRKFALNKTELSEKIGVKNAFRTGRRRPAKSTTKKICEVFDVDESWLCADHSGGKITNFTSDHHGHSQLSQPDKSYKLHGDPPYRSLEELTGVPKELGMEAAFKLLLEIYETGNLNTIKETIENLQVLKNAASLKTPATSPGVDMDKIEKRFQDLENLIATLQTIVENKGLV